MNLAEIKPITPYNQGCRYINEPTPWATPTPLRPDGTNLLLFHVNALPPILRDMVHAIATTTSTVCAHFSGGNSGD